MTDSSRLGQPMTLRLQPALVAQLDELATKQGCSRAELIRHLLVHESYKLQKKLDQLQSLIDL